MTDDDLRLHYLVLSRIDQAKRMDRYYVLSVQPALFPGDYTLLREWGRAGHSPKRRIQLFGDRAEAVRSFSDWLSRKERRGYRRGASEREGSTARHAPG